MGQGPRDCIAGGGGVDEYHRAELRWNLSRSYKQQAESFHEREGQARLMFSDLVHFPGSPLKMREWPPAVGGAV